MRRCAELRDAATAAARDPLRSFDVCSAIHARGNVRRALSRLEA